MNMHHLPLVLEFMDNHVDTLSPETDIMVAVKFLLQKRVASAPVVDSKGERWASSPNSVASNC